MIITKLQSLFDEVKESTDIKVAFIGFLEDVNLFRNQDIAEIYPMIRAMPPTERAVVSDGKEKRRYETQISCHVQLDDSSLEMEADSMARYKVRNAAWDSAANNLSAFIDALHEADQTWLSILSTTYNIELFLDQSLNREAIARTTITFDGWACG
jgi:hypothetical protein